MRGVSYITECFCPVTEAERDIGATATYLDKLARNLPPRCLHEFTALVPLTLREPDTVWAGVREPDPGADNAGFCFARYFPHRLDGNGGTYPNREGFVFCVYVNPAFLIYEFRWDESDPADHRYPRGCKTRFQRQIR